VQRRHTKRHVSTTRRLPPCMAPATNPEAGLRDRITHISAGACAHTRELASACNRIHALNVKSHTHTCIDVYNVYAFVSGRIHTCFRECAQTYARNNHVLWLNIKRFSNQISHAYMCLHILLYRSLSLCFFFHA
jgi:hypothetical protein